MNTKQTNVYGDTIEECCSSPITGFYRDGFCHTDELDRGLHVVCSLINDEFLDFSKSRGNDLSTPRPEFSFPGLKPGDYWCLCLSRWVQAFNADCAPKIRLDSTHASVLEFVDLPRLKEFAAEKF